MSVDRSFYFTLPDGVRLAVRLRLPGPSGGDLCWPLILCFYRYNLPAANPDHLRRWQRHFGKIDPDVLTGLASGSTPDPITMAPWFERLAEHGLAFGIVDIRGTGASFGTWPGPFSLQEARDAHDVIEGLAAQPWCSGQVGLVGRSYMGANQFLAALQSPPSLIGLFAEMAPYDTYHMVHQNGVFREDFARSWASDIRMRDCEAPALPVGDDTNGVALAQAREEHRANPDVFELFRAARYRDSRCPDSSVAPYQNMNPAAHIANAGGVHLPVYILSGWHDINSVDALLYQMACYGQVQSLIGPWAHAGSYGVDLAARCADWFHGLMQKSPEDRREDRSRSTLYCQMSGGGRAEWFEAKRPDLRPDKVVRLHFAPGVQRNHGTLAESVPAPALIGPRDADPEASSGLGSRWSNGYGGPFGYGDMNELADSGICLISPILSQPLELVGTPEVDVVTDATTAPALFFFLLDRHPDGFAQYVTEGALALTHRRLGPEIYPTGGRPFHRGCQADMAPAGSVSDRVRLALQPVAWRFEAEHRLQLVVTAADRDNAENTARPGQRFAFRAGPDVSWLDLPVDTGPWGHFTLTTENTA